MRYKNSLTETNSMRKLMGLDLLKEGISGPIGKDEDSMKELEKAQKMAEDRAAKEKKVKEGHYIDEDGIDIGTGIEGNYKDSKSKEDKDIAGAPESEPALKQFDDDEIFEEEDVATISFEDDDISEDTEGEETDHYGEDEGKDHEEEEDLYHEEEMAPKDRISEIERHLDALKKDMGYDEDHEDRDEEGTDFYEQKTFKVKKGGKIIRITESDIKKLSKLLKEEDDGRAMQDMTDDIEKRGTEGSFRKWCKIKNKSWDGCNTDCWKAAMATNSTSLHRKVAGAKFYCK